MDFTLDDAHQAVADLAADVLGRGDEPWTALDKAGLLDLARPAELGGDGLGVLATSLVITELGRRAADVPWQTLAVLPDVDDKNLLLLAGACAFGDGLLAGALDLTTKHIGTRTQFGRPLATFQAVAQQIADVYVASRTLHLATVSACWRLDEGHADRSDVDVAAYWLAAELVPAMHTCHHLHGGLGLDITYPMHRYYALAKQVTRLVGGVDVALDRLGAAACSSN